jgi:hypothetical protein
MSTRYVVFRIDRGPEGEPKVRIRHVYWLEQEAVEMVERLNETSSSGDGGYHWSPVSVARRRDEMDVTLTPKDRKYLELAGMHGVLDTERPVAVFFSFIFNAPGARAACEELRSLGWPDVGYDEERTGDECWHVYAHRRRLVLNAPSILRLRAEMEDLAERHGGTFDQWDISGGQGLGWAEPGELPT